MQRKRVEGWRKKVEERNRDANLYCSSYTFHQCFYFLVIVKWGCTGARMTGLPCPSPLELSFGNRPS